MPEEENSNRKQMRGSGENEMEQRDEAKCMGEEENTKENVEGKKQEVGKGD